MINQTSYSTPRELKNVFDALALADALLVSRKSKQTVIRRKMRGARAIQAAIRTLNWAQGR